MGGVLAGQDHAGVADRGDAFDDDTVGLTRVTSDHDLTRTGPIYGERLNQQPVTAAQGGLHRMAADGHPIAPGIEQPAQHAARCSVSVEAPVYAAVGCIRVVCGPPVSRHM